MVCRKTRHLGRISRLVTGCLVFGLLLAPLALPLATSTTAHAQSVRVVPEGNRFKSQPKIPFASSRRTAASKSSYDAKFDKVLAVLKRDRRLMGSIKRVSARYGRCTKLDGFAVLLLVHDDLQKYVRCLLEQHIGAELRTLARVDSVHEQGGVACR